MVHGTISIARAGSVAFPRGLHHIVEDVGVLVISRAGPSASSRRRQHLREHPIMTVSSSNSPSSLCNDDDALLVQGPADDATWAPGCRCLVERVADLRRGALAVVGQGLHNDGHAAGP